MQNQILSPATVPSLPTPTDISDFDIKIIELKVVTNNTFKCKEQWTGVQTPALSLILIGS